LSVLIATIFEGAGEYSDVTLKKQLVDNSISVNVSNDDDDIYVAVSCLEQYLDKAVKILSAILSKAHLKAEKIEIAKQGCVVSINQSMFLPASLAREKCSQLMYKDGHPYQVRYSDLLKAIPEYDRDDIAKCYSSVFVPGDAEITIVSGVSEERVVEIFNEIHSAVSDRVGEYKDVDVQETELNSPGSVEHVELDNPQTTVVFALPGISKKSPEVYAAIAATEIFGRPGTITSRLAERVRGKGFVYRISASMLANRDLSSVIVGECDTRPENVQDVVNLVKDECKKIGSVGITADELEEYKHHKFATNIYDSSESTLGFVASARLYGVGVNEVNLFLDNFKRLTVSEVNAAASKIFCPEKMIVVDCGKTVSKEEGSK
jgi:zinc protease